MKRHVLFGLLLVAVAAVFVGGWVLLGLPPFSGPEVKAQALVQIGGCCGGYEMAPQTGAATGEAATKAASGKVVNTRCPIMGGVVDPNKAPASLTREFKDQKVGFCCGMCPAQWDKLSDDEKEAKLKTASGSK
jgi:hypothetical protein